MRLYHRTSSTIKDTGTGTSGVLSPLDLVCIQSTQLDVEAGEEEEEDDDLMMKEDQEREDRMTADVQEREDRMMTDDQEKDADEEDVDLLGLSL
mmetsp:Transcript_6047/g.22874  ORF Transcript_6047/g.22874 Transcript_6047/m.22874 type:complete len:94 (-) Transcript_6047:646-927(-)